MTGPAYRFVLADDPDLWTAGGDPELSEIGSAARLEAWERLNADGTALVVVCGARQAADVRREAAMVRAGADTPIVVMPLELGPLGQLVVTRLGELLVAAGLGRPVAELVALLPRLAGSLLDVGLVSSVTRLDLPAIRVRHHLISYLPGSRTFAVQLGPEPAVARVRGRSRGLPLNPPGFDLSAGAVLTSQGPRDTPQELLQLCHITGPGRTATPQLPLDRFWRDGDATEIVVGPADLAGWARGQLPGLEQWPCSWCGEPLAAPMRSCPFCGHTWQ